jgi:dihydrodipicolinate synthase/N-acetylneuraminate lyase
LCGWEAAMVPMLAMGCQGGTFAMSGIVPEVTRRLFQLAKAGQLSQARALQMRLTTLFDRIIYGANFPEGVRAAVELRGFHFGPSRQPADESQHLDRDELGKMIADFLAGLE